MTLYIDTLETNREFTKSGMSKKTSDAITKKFIEVEKNNKKEFLNVKTFNSEIKDLRKDLKNTNESFRQELKTECESIRQEFRYEFKLVRQEIKTSMLATIISLGTIMALIEKFL